MTRKKGIAYIFLGIISMLMFHKVLPHVHHIHLEASSHNEVAHTHGHEHHHGEHRDNQSQEGLFDWFLDMHIHTNITNDLLVLDSTSVEKVVAKKDLVKTDFNFSHNKHHCKDVDEIVEWDQPPDKELKAYLSSYSLRGPPALG